MKKIVKRAAPPSLESFKAHFFNTYGRVAVYKDLPKEEYKILKEQLIDEQYGICCYCMKRIRFDNAHIEHFVPQSEAPDQTLEYQNMMASCNGYKENHENCGHKKGNWYHDYQMISPLTNQCEQEFLFSVDGTISSQTIAGKETIRHLELDNSLLNRARRSAIFTAGLFDDDFEDRKTELITYYSQPHDGQLLPFCQAIVSCIQKQ